MVANDQPGLYRTRSMIWAGNAQFANCSAILVDEVLG